MLREVLSCCTGAPGQAKTLLVQGGSVSHARELCQRFQRLTDQGGYAAGIERRTILRVDFVNGCTVYFKSLNEDGSTVKLAHQRFTDPEATALADKRQHPWRFRGAKSRKIK